MSDERLPEEVRASRVIGTIVAGRYRVQRLLGRGGMGAVYEALDTATSALVAVKVISEELAESAQVRSRFAQEQRAAAAIDSPHLVRVLETGEDEGRAFLAMEYLVGEDLHQLLQRVGPLGEQLALKIVGQACLGVARAHEASVVHRDLKPANLFLARDASGRVTVKVLDFGVAKLLEDDGVVGRDGALTRTGTVLGSPLYMSPEQARGGRAVGPSADLWSLGVVLYRAMSGREPYDTVTGLGDLIIAICTRPAPPVQLYAPWVTRETAAIVHRALSLDPSARQRDARQLVEQLRERVADFDLHVGDLVGMSELDRTRRAGTDEPTLAVLASAREPRGAHTPRSTGGRRVLLVEDNELNMDMLARRLEKKGYEVVRATDGEAGVTLGRSSRPDLVLMDIGLPGMDGWEATRALRAAEETRATPIIALTAHAMGGERETAMAAGCDEYESKPIEFARLLAKIEALLGRR